MPTEVTTKSLGERQRRSQPGAVSELAVTGMTCGNCARHVTEAIQSVPGVRSAEVSLDTQRGRVRWADGAVRNVAAVIRAVEEAGYGAEVVADVGARKPSSTGHGLHDHTAHRLAGWRLNLWVGLLATLPLMVGEWVFALGTARWFQWLSFVLAGLVQVLAGGRFFRVAWNQLRVGRSNMDTLVALGSSTAFAYST